MRYRNIYYICYCIILYRLSETFTHQTLNQCWSDVVPPSTTFGQHWTNIDLMSCFYCVSGLVAKTRPFHTSLQTRDIYHSGTTTRCCFRNYPIQLGWWETADRQKIIFCLPHLNYANKDILKEPPAPMAHSYRLGL